MSDPDDIPRVIAKAKREERERIICIASFTLKIDGNTVIIDKHDWDNLWRALMEENETTE